MEKQGSGITAQKYTIADSERDDTYEKHIRN